MANKTKRKKFSKKKITKKKIIELLPYIIILTILIFTFIYTLYQNITWLIDNHNTNKIINDLNTQTKININTSNSELINAPDEIYNDYWYYANKPFYNISFDEYLKTNQNTVGYIHLDNTNIDYPVVQSKNNTYYLNHSFNNHKNNAGWIFMDYRNNLDSLDDNTIIYGHGRKDGTMFGSLRTVLTNEWQNNKDNYVIWLSTPKTNYVFQIFSIYTIKEETYYLKTNFSNSKDKIEWLQTMKSRNKAPIKTEVNEQDKILTLSTCKNNSGDRIVVHAKLIKKQSTNL